MRVTSLSFVCLRAALAIAFTAGAAAAQSSAPPDRAASPAVHDSILDRVNVQTATVSLRYKINENSRGTVTANHVQESASLKVRFNADEGGRFSVTAGAGTGSSFASGWNNTGLGSGGAHHDDVFLKQLYMAAAPLRGVEVQAGGLYVVRGETTEISSYDNDGFVAGGRVSLRTPRHLFFDEVALTVGNIGDATTANVFRRFEQMRDFDYRQALVARKFGKAVGVSVDYTRHGDAETVRQAITFRSRAIRVLDGIRFEQYARVADRRDYGFALQADKAVSKTLAVGGGYADIDQFHGGLNGDKYVTGRRLFASTTLALGPAVTASAYLTRAVANDFAVANRTRVDFILTYNVLRSFTP